MGRPISIGANVTAGLEASPQSLPPEQDYGEHPRAGECDVDARQARLGVSPKITP